MGFKNILFPVDGSQRCTAVAPFVRAVVEKYAASLTVASFVEVPAICYAGAEVPVAPEIDPSRLIEECECSLAFFAADAFPGLKPTIRVEQGDPGNLIPELARTIGADLIMMPTHGRGRFRAALLGSVTAKVLHDAHCAVWTAAHAESAEHPMSREWRRIVCAVDTTPEAYKLMGCAAKLAATHAATVRLVHAVPASPEAGQERYFDRDLDIFLKDTARKTINDMQKAAGTSFEVCLGDGGVSTVVAAAALDYHADLVLAGRGTLPEFAGKLRTHLYGIIREASCPVLSV